MKKIKKKLWDNRGKICIAVGATIGGVLAYKYYNDELIRSHKEITRLKDALSDTDAYAEKRAEVLADIILDMARDHLIDMDESPEMKVSEITFDVLAKCRDNVFYNTNAFIQNAGNDLANTIEIMKELGELPAGTYGSVKIEHF